jgi:hypothetical protein
MTDALTTDFRQSGRASTEGQLNIEEWGKLVWVVALPSHAPLQAQSTNFLNRLRIYLVWCVKVQLYLTLPTTLQHSHEC